MYTCKEVTCLHHSMGLQKFQWGKNPEHFCIILQTRCRQFLYPQTLLLSFSDVQLLQNFRCRTVLPNLYKETNFLISQSVVLHQEYRGVSWSVRHLTDRWRQSEEILGSQAHNDRAVVTTAFHINRPHYARSEVLTTMSLKIWGSQSTDCDNYCLLGCNPMQLSNKLHCITFKKRVLFNCIILAYISRLSSIVISPAPIYWFNPPNTSIWRIASSSLSVNP